MQMVNISACSLQAVRMDEQDAFAVFGLRADGDALDHRACLYIHRY